MLRPPRSACLPICLPSGFVFHLGWGAVSVRFAGLVSQFVSQSPTWLCLSPWAGVLCPPRLACLPICLPSGSCLRACLPICLPPTFVFHVGLGCCVRLARLVSQFVSQFVSHLALSFTLAGVLCPLRWACLRACLPICLPPGFVFHLGLGCCVRLARLVSQFVSQFVSHLALGSGLVSQFVSHLALSFTLGWCAVSALLGLSPGLSPNLSPIWLCLSPWAGVLCPLRWACLRACLPICLPPGFVFHLGLGCCVRLARLVSQFVSQFVSRLALSFTLGCGAVSASLGLSPGLSPNLSPTWLCLSPWAGVLCPLRWACLPICLPPGFVFHLRLGCCVRLARLVPICLPICLPPGFVFHLGLGCCVRLAGLVSQFVSHLALSFTLTGVLCPLRWACLRACLPICLPPGFVPQTVYCWGSQCCLKCVRLGWGAVSASLGLSPGLSPNLSPAWLCLSPWAGVLCPPRSACLPICLPSGFVFHLGWGAVSVRFAGLVSQFVSQSPTWLCLSPWAGVLCPPRLACLPICLPSGSCLRACLPICLPPTFVFHVGLGCCVRLARLVSQFVSQFVSHLALSFTLAGVLCPLRWACLRACLPICLPPGFVFHLGLGCCVRLARLVSQFVSQFVSHLALVSGLVSQFVSHLALSFTLGWCALLGLSPGLSPNLSPIWLCLSPWAGVLCPLRWACLRACLPICLPPGFVFHLGLRCCVRFAGLVSGLVSQFVSHLALSFTLGWGAKPACLPICLPPGFVFHLRLGCCVRLARLVPICLPICVAPGFVFHLGLGCCVRLAGLVSQFVSHLALSFTLTGVLCPLRWACLRACLPICLPPGFVPQTVYCWGSQCCLKCVRLGWGAVSASLGFSPTLSPNLSPTWLCPPWLGCCVRFAGLVSGLVSQFVSRLALSFTLGWGAVSASLGLSPNLSPIWLCLSPWLGCCVRPLRWACLPICLPISHLALSFTLGWGAVSASLGLSPNLSPIWLLSPGLSPNLSPTYLCLSCWAGVLCPPRSACLPICLPSGFVFHLGWGAVSASLGLSPGLSPNLSPTWLCLSPWAGVLCPPRSACLPICLPICLPSGSWLRSCLPICLPPGFVFHLGLVCCVRLARLVSGLVSQFVSHLALSFTLGWGAVSASLGLSPGLSPNLSPTWLCLSPWAGVLCPPRSACLPICLPPGFVFHLGLRCCVRFAGLVSGLVSQFVSHLALSFTLGWGAVSASLGLSPNLSPAWLCLSPSAGVLCPPRSACPNLSPNLSPTWLCLSPWAGVLCPPRWACLPICLPICLPSGFVFHLDWGAVSASLGLSPGLSPNLSPTWLCSPNSLLLGFSMLS